VNGRTFEYSLPGGGFISFSQLVEALGILDTAAEAVVHGGDTIHEAHLLALADTGWLLLLRLGQLLVAVARRASPVTTSLRTSTSPPLTPTS